MACALSRPNVNDKRWRVKIFQLTGGRKDVTGEFDRRNIGERALIIGGGFTAMDCARTAYRLGAKTTRVVYRRSVNEMLVTPGELEELDTEGIPLECHATPIAYLEENGKLTGMKFHRTGTHEEFDVPADCVLLATGQFPDHGWECETEEFQSLETLQKVFHGNAARLYQLD